MGDRGHNRQGRKEAGAAVPLSGGSCMGLRLTQCGLGRGLLRTKWRFYPSSRLATIDMGRMLGGAVPLFEEGKLGPHLTQSRLGRDLPPYQVTS